MRNSISCRFFARYALFCDPVNRLGGEKMSYQLPTYQALKGMMESIYWKPTFDWVIDQVRVMNPIRFEDERHPPYHLRREEHAVYIQLPVRCGVSGERAF